MDTYLSFKHVLIKNYIFWIFKSTQIPSSLLLQFIMRLENIITNDTNLFLKISTLLFYSY